MSATARTSNLTHPVEVTAIHDRILAGSPAKNRLVEVGNRQRAHLIESGDGPPLVLFNGSGPSALLMLPLLERLEGVWGIGVDRPGFGLSDPAEVPRGRLRHGAVEFVDHVLDALGLDKAAVGGSSMGGTVALWYALARPERVRQLVLLSTEPLLPGTRVPPAICGTKGGASRRSCAPDVPPFIPLFSPARRVRLRPTRRSGPTTGLQLH